MKADIGTVYVVGAAGHQGGAAMQHLRARGLDAHALFDERDARRLRDRRWDEPSARLASFDDPVALERALSGAGALFLVLEHPDTGPAERLRHGRAISEAAARAGIRHIVFAAATGSDHHRLSCDVSSEVERYLHRIDVPTTVLRPATFMEEIPWYWLSRFGRELTLATPFVATNHLPLVALDDVGALGALALASPEEFVGRTIEVAGDTVTPLEIVERLTGELGEPVQYREVQVEGVFIYQEASTPVHDIDWLRSLYPPLHTFTGWLEQGGGLELCRRSAERPAGQRMGRAA
jgi:uncharacterized protein YbjT (DUF2867 family)